MDKISFSCVICSIDRAKFERITKQLAALLRDEPHEIVGIHDAKSLCEGYNRGFAQSRGEWLIFCHDDIEFLNFDFRDRLKRHAEQFDIIGVAGSDRVVGGLWSLAGPPYIHGQIAHFNADSNTFDVSIFSTAARGVGNIQVLDGVFMAVRRTVFEKVRFDDVTFDGFHGYDIDFTFSAHLGGFRVGVASDILLVHHSIGTTDATWQHYVQKFNRKHLRSLYPQPRREFVVAKVRVNSREEVVEVMTPRLWGESSM